ncbi:MAG TPA: methylated-DNA--[protein]-cysteine S-methyltransferase [Planctomycetaceae bacterium]|jgi:methylated-DNA-[protein]-cysteine S-methyltransferase|nr:methylated-DNA--[protein]-cysteine S-methyltransferase [Planctomycetaceae bacterium]
MGQRPAATVRRRGRSSRNTVAEPRQIEASIFATALGWIGFAGTDTTVVALTIGHASAEEVRSAIRSHSHGRSASRHGDAGPLVERDWYPELRRALERYAQGQPVDLKSFKVDLGRTTAYRKKVLETARRIPYGKTLSYGELAARSGKPRAARAVGSAMASNRVALLIPCHRVVAAGGAIGGFSCRTGVELKQRLLEMEADGVRGKSHGTRPGAPL